MRKPILLAALGGLLGTSALGLALTHRSSPRGVMHVLASGDTWGEVEPCG